MTKEEAKKILTEYVKACREDDMLTLEQFTYEEVIEAMDIGAEAISVLSVSSDLEEAANEFAEGEWDGMHDDDGNALFTQDYVEYSFIAGAKWQGEKDQETIKLAEDHAFLAGADWQKEQMMKEAVNTVVSLEAGGFPFVEFGVSRFGLKVGDKVRLIVLPKEGEK